MRKVRAERVGSRIHLRTPYLSDPWEWQEQLDALKRIPGANFAKASKAWTYPLDLAACRAMRRAFGDRLELGEELTAWGRAAIKRERELKSVLDLDPREPAALVNLPAVAPTLAAAVTDRGYQSVAAKFGAMAGAHGNFDEQGLGKCVESFAALLEGGVYGKGLLIAPRTALNVTWAPEVERWLDDVPGDVLVHMAHLQEMPRRPGRSRAATAPERAEAIDQFLEEADDYTMAFLLVNPQMLNTTKTFTCSRNKNKDKKDRCLGEESCPNKRNHKVVYEHLYPKLHTTQWDFVIGDETHQYVLHGRQKKPTQVGLGFHKLQVKPMPHAPDGVRIALTGTPLKGRPTNLWATLAWLRPSVYTSRWNFAANYLASKPNPYTHSGVEYIEEIAKGRMKDLDKELSSIIIRRTSAELRELNPAWAPPPIQYIEKWVDLTPKQADAYDEMERDAQATLDGRVLTSNGILSWMTRLKQFASAEYGLDGDGNMVVTGAGAKFEWLVDEFLPGLGIRGNQDLDEGGAKVLVASQFTKHLNYWRKQLLHMGIECFILTGETPDDQRVAQQKRFLKPGGPRVFLLQTLTGGVSITLDSADYGVIMDETFVPDDQDQVEKRNHRASDVNHFVKWYYVRSRGTIEAAIASGNETKRGNDKRVMDGRRGVEWAQKHFGVQPKDRKRRRAA